MGAPPEVVESLRGRPAEPDDCWVWPENWMTIQVFVRLNTQWRRHLDGMSGANIWIGLRYDAAEVVMRMLAIPRREWPDTFERLTLLEATALPLLNDKD